MDNITAKVSCFARAYHSAENTHPVFDDPAARPLLGPDYREIARSMTEGMDYFLSGLSCPPQEGLRLIVDGQLAPPVLARSAFCESRLAEEVRRGCRQYVLFAAGYDTFSLRNQDANLTVFELDLPALLQDKRLRIDRAGLSSRAVYIPCDLADPAWADRLLQGGYRPEERAFGSLLGLSYYLRREELTALLTAAGHIMAAGSALCLDYPVAEEGQAGRTQQDLAREAGEPMRGRYTPEEMEALLTACGFSVREHLSPEDMTRLFFARHNRLDPEHPMATPEGVRYLLAAKA